MSLEGQQIGRYRILQLLGSGGMGDVYLAEDARIEQQVAIKVIRTEVSPYPDAQSAEKAARLFQREAKAVGKLDHPNILPLFDYGEEQLGKMKLIYLVMPYRQEGSLADWLRQRAKAELLSPQDVAHYVRQAADALQHAHDRQIIHQDVKPSNFLIRSRKGTPNLPDLLLADFGIARFTTATSSVSQSVRGTPSYMAPEQWEGEPVPATDQYALAVMAYELLTGRLPFQGGPGRMMYQHINVQPVPPSTLNSRLAKDIDMVLLHALAKRPEERFASITAFANAFQQAVQGIQRVESAADSAAIKTSAPTVSNTNNQPISPVTRSNVIPGKVGSAQPVLENAGATWQNQNTSNVAQGGVTRVLGGDEFVGGPSRTENVPPTHGSGIAVLRRRAKRWPMLIVALVLLALLLVGGVIASVVRVAFGTMSVAIVPGSATVTITPASMDLKNSYTLFGVTGNPDTAQRQIQARQLTSTTPAQTQTINATGVEKTSGSHATGTLGLENHSNAPITLNAGQIFSNQSSNVPSVEMVLDVTLTAPPKGYVTGPGHVLQVGAVGNMPRVDRTNCGSPCYGFCNPACFSFYGDCTCYVLLNATAFAGGQDPQNYTVVQQSDINGAANALINANTPNPQQVLQPQIQAIQANERLVSSPQCKPNVTSDHSAGDKATNVTVTVTFTCTSEVYDYGGALSLAANLLKEQAASNPGAGYALVGKIATTVTQASVTDASQGTVTLTVDAEGMWAFQFSAAQKQMLAKLLAGKKLQDARALLLNQIGVKQADVQVLGGGGNTLPTDSTRITIVVQGV